MLSSVFEWKVCNLFSKIDLSVLFKSSLIVILFIPGATTYIKDLDGGEDEKFFTFDFSYWSYDGFEDVDGYLTPTGDKYDDQV